MKNMSYTQSGHKKRRPLSNVCVCVCVCACVYAISYLASTALTRCGSVSVCLCGCRFKTDGCTGGAGRPGVDPGSGLRRDGRSPPTRRSDDDFLGDDVVVIIGGVTARLELVDRGPGPLEREKVCGLITAG